MDSIEPTLLVRSDESLAVEPENRRMCARPAPRDLARAEVACVELLLFVQLDMILENSRRRFGDSEDEIEVRS